MSTVLSRPLPTIRPETGKPWTVDVAKSWLQKDVRRCLKTVYAPVRELIEAGYPGCVLSSLRTIVNEDIGPANSEMTLICERFIQAYERELRISRIQTASVGNPTDQSTSSSQTPLPNNKAHLSLRCQQLIYFLVALVTRSKKSRICDIGFYYAFTGGRRAIESVSDVNGKIMGKELVDRVKEEFKTWMFRCIKDRAGLNFDDLARGIGGMYIVNQEKYAVEYLRDHMTTEESKDVALVGLCKLFLSLKKDDGRYRLLLIHIFIRYIYLNLCPKPAEGQGIDAIDTLLEKSKDIDIEQLKKYEFKPPPYAIDKHTVIGRTEFKRGFQYFFDEGTRLNNRCPELEAVDHWTELCVAEILAEEKKPTHPRHSHDYELAQFRKKYEIPVEPKRQPKKRAERNETEEKSEPKPKKKRRRVDKNDTNNQTIPQLLDKLNSEGRRQAKIDAARIPGQLSIPEDHQGSDGAEIVTDATKITELMKDSYIFLVTLRAYPDWKRPSVEMKQYSFETAKLDDLYKLAVNKMDDEYIYWLGKCHKDWAEVIVRPYNDLLNTVQTAVAMLSDRKEQWKILGTIRDLWYEDSFMEMEPLQMWLLDGGTGKFDDITKEVQGKWFEYRKECLTRFASRSPNLLVTETE